MALISDIPQNSWRIWPSHRADYIAVIYTVLYTPASSRVIVTYSSVLWRIINTPRSLSHTHTHTHTHKGILWHMMFIGPCIICDSWRTQNQLDRTYNFYFTSWRLNMFRALICPSSGVCDYIVELPHWLFRSWFAESGSPDTTPADPHPNSNTQEIKNETANIVAYSWRWAY